MKCYFCNNPGKFGVAFTAYALGHSKIARNQIHGHFNVDLCESHAKTIKREDLIGKSGWEKIQQALLSRGRSLLDSSTLEIEVVTR